MISFGQLLMSSCLKSIIVMQAITVPETIGSSCSPGFVIQGALDRFAKSEPGLLLAVSSDFFGGKTFHFLETTEQIPPKKPFLAAAVILPFRNLKPDISQLDNTILRMGFYQKNKDAVKIIPIEFNRFSVLFLIESMKNHLINIFYRLSHQINFTSSSGYSILILLLL